MLDFIAAAGVSFGYQPGKPVIKDLTFNVPKGSICAFLGENGCGKTTLLDLILGILSPHTGSIKVGGTLSFVPQKFNLPFNFSCAEIALMGRASKISVFSTPKKVDEEKVQEAFSELEIEDLLPKNFGELSGGQQQMVLIARSLASESDIILLDEPASALDLKNQDKLLSLLVRLSVKKNKTLIFSTHHPNHALAVADHVLLMYRGTYEFGEKEKILTEEKLSQLFEIPILRTELTYNDRRFGDFVPAFSALLTKRTDRSEC